MVKTLNYSRWFNKCELKYIIHALYGLSIHKPSPINYDYGYLWINFGPKKKEKGSLLKGHQMWMLDCLFVCLNLNKRLN